MIICVDCDGVLNDLTEKVLKLYNSRSGKNIKIEDITSYNFYDCLPIEDADSIISLFKEKSLWDSLVPLPGSQDALKKLCNEGHSVYIATATDITNFSWKCEWLSKFYSFIPTDNIIRIMDKSLLKIDILIEDNLNNLINNICERICIDYPYNRSSSKDFSYDIHRAKNWDDVINIIKNIERKDQEWMKVI